MNPMRKSMLLCAAVLLGGANQAVAETNILFIMDASNSMWGQIDGTAKIETAKQTLGKLLTDLPAGTKLGLMAYGHRSEKDCNDIELLSPIGAENGAALAKRVLGLTPTGKTPIAGSLEQSKAAFKGLESQNNFIVLISDGIESCAADPCAVAASLKDSGINVRAHVVGFGLTKEEGKQLTCIADNTGGKYFDAGSTVAFNDAVKEVAALTEKAPEPPPAPTAVVYFSDDFSEPELAPHWDMLNPNPDQFIVENGHLLVIGKAEGGMTAATTPNIFKLAKDLPPGDWTATIVLKTTLQTGRDLFSFGLYDDDKNFIAGTFYGQNDVCCYQSGLFLRTVKMAGGEKTEFGREAYPQGTNDYAAYVKSLPGGGKVTLRFVKKDRSYKSMSHVEGHVDKDGKPVWNETDVVTSLRAPKQFAVNAAQWGKTAGETMFEIDSITIETFQ
jgi:hypothetical protein